MLLENNQNYSKQHTRSTKFKRKKIITVMRFVHE